MRGEQQCPTCNGRGVIISYPEAWRPKETVCPDCLGHGYTHGPFNPPGVLREESDDGD